jgi:hypothetical protein
MRYEGLIASLFVIVACSGGGSSSGGSSGSISTSSYSKTCAVDADCKAVVEGDVCEVCACANAAIAQSDAQRYQSDRAALAQSCPDRGRIQCGPCAQPSAICNAGSCAYGSRPADAGGD